jgi:peroxiredoxin
MRSLTYASIIAASFVVALACTGPVHSGSKDAVQMGATVPEFTLKDPSTGKEMALADLRKGADGKAVPLVISFWSYKCPTGRGMMDRYGECAANVEKKGAKFVGVCSYGESAAEVAAYAKEHGIKYPLGHDEGVKVAQLLDAKIVTATYVLSADGKLAYRGGLGEKDSEKWPEQAVDELLAGKPVSKAETKAYG